MTGSGADPAVRQLAERLAGELETLVVRLLAAIAEHEPSYAAAGPQVLAELEHSCRENLRNALLVLSNSSDDRFGPPSRTGRRRAEQGMALESVLRAYRLGGRVLWEGMVRVATDRPGPIDQAGLLEAASRVWQVIDEDSAEVTRAYREQESRMRGHDLRRAQALLDALIDGRGRDPAVARAAARSLDMPADGRFVCVVALLDPLQPDPLRHPQEALAAVGLASAWQVRSGSEYGLVAVGEHTADDVLSALRGSVAGRVGLSPIVDGFAGLGTGYRLAELVARTFTHPDAGIAQLDERIPETLLAASPETASRLLARTLAPILELPAAEQRMLLATLDAVLASDGSPTRAAARLSCHRNTVMYRLGRLTSVLGRDVLADHRERLLFSLALLAMDQRGRWPAQTRPERSSAGSPTKLTSPRVST